MHNLAQFMHCEDASPNNAVDVLCLQGAEAGWVGLKMQFNALNLDLEIWRERE